MKRIKFLLPLGIVAFIFQLCQVQQFTPANFQGKQLSFGEGGGFTGQVNSYILLENGQLFQSNSLNEETKPLKALNRSKSRELFEEAQMLELEKLNFNRPGNQYYFIQLKQGDHSQKVTWGKPDAPVPAQVESFYQKLQAYLPKN